MDATGIDDHQLELFRAGEKKLFGGFYQAENGKSVQTFSFISLNKDHESALQAAINEAMQRMPSGIWTNHTARLVELPYLKEQNWTNNNE